MRVVKRLSSNKKLLPLPVFEELENISSSYFNNQLGWTIPNGIVKSIKHNLREYQLNAIFYYHMTQTTEQFKYRNMNHVLFNMATGSGKTDIMASLILYLFKEQGYQNFLFLVNTNGVLTKTIDNLTNQSSIKYLFNQIMEIDGERISIEQVDNFKQNLDKNTIYIKLGTVQSVSSDIYTVKENSMGLKSYEKDKVVILGDEAHHFSASTKSEKEKEKTWEGTINDILNAHKDNKLLEFSATIDLSNKNIYSKYKDKIVYKYTLDKFILEGFSKNVLRIETSTYDKDKMLDAVLLSQLRKDIGRKYDPNFKPVIMFKSQKIDSSNNAEKNFIDIINSITVENLKSFLERQMLTESGDFSALKLSYEYYLKLYDEGKLSKKIVEIQNDFSHRNIINANDTDRSGMIEKGQYNALNTLESPNNDFRVVFAVAKLTEGWDVLNLYDIVRLSENAKSDRKSTTSEAQLIGRGARYNPFKIDGKISFTRRFDDRDKSNKLLEQLHFHTSNESQYVKNLVKSLEEINLISGSDKIRAPLETKVKSSFKKSNAYKKGSLYYNKTIMVEDSYYSDISKYGINNSEDVTIELLSSSRELNYKDKVSSDINLHQIALFKTGVVPERYYKKAMARNSFFHFANIKKILPMLKSMNEFLEDKWLNIYNRKIFVSVPVGITYEELEPTDVLKAIEIYLQRVEVVLKSNFKKSIGTSEFTPIPICDLIKDYSKNPTPLDLMTEKIDKYENNEEWFVYSHAIVNGLENKLISHIGTIVDKIKIEGGYDEVFLLRLDENNYLRDDEGVRRSIKLHKFKNKDPNDIDIFNGFMPDFVLYVGFKDIPADRQMYHIYIEPKGADRELNDKWKEDLLLSLNDAEISFEDKVDDLKLLGVKFFVEGKNIQGEKVTDSKGTIKQIMELINLECDEEDIKIKDKIKSLGYS